MDKAPAVSSAAVVSAYHMAVKGTSNEVVKRWVSEAQSAVSSDNVMVQYHALGLLYHIRYNNPLNRDWFESNFGVPGTQGRHENALFKNFEMSPHLICL